MINTLTNRFDRLYNSTFLPWTIIAVGIALRLNRYIQNPSLYFDEAGSATDLADRPFADLLNLSPDATSTYPLTYQSFVKLSISIFGNTEFALRFHSIFFGIASLFIFYFVAKKYISKKAVPASLFLFAILDPLVYYSSIVKPYSADVFFTLVLFGILAYCRSMNFDHLRKLLFALAGAASIWFFHPSVFVLAGLGSSLILFSIIKKEWQELAGLAAICAVWLVSFIVYYFLFLKAASSDIGVNTAEVLKRENAFFPFPPVTLSDIKWYVDTFFATFNFIDNLDFNYSLMLTGITALFFLAGCTGIYRRDKVKLITIISPIFVTIVAAALHQYPFKGRLILFLVPLFLLLIAEGVEVIRENVSYKSRATVTIMLVFLFLYPTAWAAYHVKKPLSKSGVKPALEYIKDNWQDGDIIYVHFYAQYEFEYYAKYHKNPFDFADNEYITGIAPRNWYKIWRRNRVSEYYDSAVTTEQTNTDILKVYRKDLNQLVGKERVWLVFVDGISSTGGIKDKNFFLFYLDTKGEKIDSFNYKRLTSVYLYNLKID